MKNYKTSDLPLAAYLKTVGYQLQPIEVDHRSKVTFVFGVEDLTDIESAISDFELNNALVSPSEYYANVRFLKTLLSKNWINRDLSLGGR